MLFRSKLKFDCEWAAWSNCTAVRELDFHDTFLAADYSHPGDNIPPLLAVAQQKKKSGLDLLRVFLHTTNGLPLNDFPWKSKHFL
mgnify:CR=1 FL=1